MENRQRPLPSLFVPHGAPTFALRPGEAGAALAGVAADLPRPRAIVIVSAHWETEFPTVGSATCPETIYDFWGFPEALYSLHYPAAGSEALAAAVHDALVAAGLPARTDPRRGLDHGAWIPLRMMFPDADVPVVPLSIQGHLGPEHHYRVGRALAPLARQGFLVVTSGNLTHNLSDYRLAATRGGQAPDYVRAFPDWLWQRLEEGDLPALLEYRQRAPEAVRAHPRDEHLLPFYVALGAGGEGAVPRRLHAGVEDYVIAMDAFAFQEPSAAIAA